MSIAKIAVVGCGGVSAMHFDAYRRHPERVRVVAVCDPNFESARRVQAQNQSAVAFGSLEEMIAGADWDVGIVCTPTSVREGVVRTLAAAGKHAFVEKPLADTLVEAEQLVAACADAGVQLAVDQNFRTHYPFDLARRIVAEGRLGRVLTINHQDLMFRQDGGWRADLPRYAMSVMGIHWLDGFRLLLGQEATSVTCRTHSSPQIACAGETEATVQIVFEGGAVATYVESFSSPVSRCETLITGEKGSLKLDYSGAAFWDAGAGREPSERWDNPHAGSEKPESVFAALDQLLTAIEQDSEPANSGRDNLKTVALLDAAYRSAETGQAVTLEHGRPL